MNRYSKTKGLCEMALTRSQSYIDNTLEPTYTFTKKHFYTYIMEINLAHTLMLKKQQIVSDEDASKIAEATLALLKKGYNKEYDPGFEDLFFMIESDLSNAIGPELVGNMHIAFSRNDMDTTMFRMLWRQKLSEWIEQINDLRETLLELIDEHKETVMPAHTHNQQAQPTTLAHYLLAVENNLQRDVERGIALYNRINHCPMGAAALATTGFDIDRYEMSDQLGFSSPLPNSYDAISASDFMLEIGSVLSISLSTLSRFVYDLMFMATNEVNTLRLHDQHVQTSSIMPQKRNPSALEHTRASISKAIAELQGCFTVAHSVPLGDIVDIGDDIQPPLLSGVDHTYGILAILTEILQHASFNKTKLYQSAEDGFSTVTELADVLVRNHSVSFRTAHKIVSELVKELTKNGQDIRQGNADLVNFIAKKKVNVTLSLSKNEFKRAIDPKGFVAVRKTLGGPAPREVERQLNAAHLTLKKDQNWIAGTFHSLSQYSTRLEENAKLCVKDNHSV